MSRPVDEPGDWLFRERQPPTPLQYVAIGPAVVVAVCDIAIASALSANDTVTWAGSLPLAMIPVALLACWLLRPQRPARFTTWLSVSGALVYIWLGLEALGRAMS